MTLDTKKLLMIGAVVVACTQIGNGLRAAAYLVNVPSTAYAAQETANKVDDQFSRYLEGQQKVADALNQYVANQERQQAPNQMYQRAPDPQGIREYDADDVCWQCPDNDRDTCYRDNLWKKC